MKYKAFGDTVAIRLNRGDEVMKSLRTVCQAEHITTATISGIGAADSAVIGLYQLETRALSSTPLKGDMEITNLTGNVSQKDGELYLHVHITMADRSGWTMGGHLTEATISGAGEIFIRRLPGEIGRILDDETGLNMMDW